MNGKNGLKVLLTKKIADIKQLVKIIFGCCMRKESQHFHPNEHLLPNVIPQCQETTKKYKRMNQIKSKNDFLDWLRSLPFQIRYLAVKVEAPGLAQITRQTLRRLQSKNDSDNKKFTHKSNKNILDSIVFTSDGRDFFDSICFDYAYIEFPQRLYELLMYSGQNVKKFNPIEDMQKNRKPIAQSCEEIKHLKSKEQLCKTLVRVLRHQVFFNTCHKQEIRINDQKNRKKQLSFYWKNLTQQLKHQILYLKKKDLKALNNFLTDSQIILPLEELEKEIGELVKLEKNEFCNRIFKCKLKKSLTALTDYHSLVYSLWKSQYEKIKKIRTKKMQPASTQKNEEQKQSPEFVIPKEKKPSRSSKRNRSLLLTEKQNSIDSFQTNETQVYQKQEETVASKSFLKESFLNEFIEKKITHDIKEFTDMIAKEANFYHDARVLAFERIKFVLDWYSVPIKVFGSCANGIAIKNSDIDIAIDNSIVNYFHYCPEQKRVTSALESLEGIFKSFKCIKNIKFIKSASIPIIKLTLDTSEQFPVDQNFFAFDVSSYRKQLNRPHVHSLIQIDITVETHSQTLKSNHLGIITTRRINQWLQQFVTLKPIILILKYYLFIHELNTTYKDGINTYGMVVMIVAFMRHLKLQREENIVKVMESVLRFIVEEFDEKVYGIDLRNKKDIFYKKTEQKDPSVLKAELEILDPENDGKNMTKKCYKFHMIKDVFSLILKRCFQDQRKSIISGFLKDKKLNFANTQNQNNLKKLSLQQITNEMGNPFVDLAKEHEGSGLKLEKQHEVKKQTGGKIEQRYESETDYPTEMMGYIEGMMLLRTGSEIKG